MYPCTDLLGDFGSFVFIREVAAGGQGTVFMARLEDGQEVAVKAIRLELELSDEERQARISHLEQEMKTVKALIHPNVVRHFSTAYTAVLASPIELPRYYVTMELCRGTLAKEAKKNPINGFYLQKWSRDILSGLAYLHINRIVHRDLKSDNIFLSCNDRETCVMKIGDLGDIKHLLDSHQQISESRGTFAHMSPEMIKGTVSPRHCVFQRTDIWSFGSVMIEMLTGDLPRFVNGYKAGQPVYYQGRGCETPIMFFVGRGGRPEICESWPEAARDVICSCLQGDPEVRPTASELLESPFIKGEPPVWDRGDGSGSPPIKGPCHQPPIKTLVEKKPTYKIAKAIAWGSYGMIYRVIMHDGSERAVKLISLDPNKEGGIAQQVAELKSLYEPLVALNHENVLRHYAVGVHTELTQMYDTPQFYMSMELGRGGTLSHAVRDHPLNGSLLYKWTTHIVSGLAYLHANKIVHRTLNSHNILLSTEDHETCSLKIGGLCDSQRLTSNVTGSHEVSAVERLMMSPEMINGAMSPDFPIGRKSDIWNVGLVVILMLTGKLPQFIYRDPDGKQNKLCRSMQEIMFFVGCGGRPEILDSWPAGCRQVIESCLQYAPGKRPSADQLLAVLLSMGEDDFLVMRKRPSSSVQHCSIS